MPHVSNPSIGDHGHAEAVGELSDRIYSGGLGYVDFIHLIMSIWKTELP